MKKNTVIFLFALCPLVPAASRFAYGIILAFAFIWLFLFGIAFRELVRRFDARNAAPYIELVCLAGSATVFFLILQRLFPILSVSLELYIYLTAFSYLLLISIDYFSIETENYLPLLPFLPFLLAFSALRELLGSGTISFPSFTGLYEIALLPGFDRFGIGFWGTSGGALIILGIFAWISKAARRKIASYRRGA